MSLKAVSREVGGVTVIDLDGRITLGDGSALLRDLIRENLNKGHKKLVLNLAAISYLDSTGLGELVSGYRFVKSAGGELKLLNLNKKVTGPSHCGNPLDRHRILLYGWPAFVGLVIQLGVRRLLAVHRLRRAEKVKCEWRAIFCHRLALRPANSDRS